MREQVGDLWSEIGVADVIVVTTNGDVRRDGCCVMGRGCARQARDRFPGIDRNLGEYIRRWGNVVGRIWDNPTIMSFPVKHHWSEPADPRLIAQSARRLVLVADAKEYQRIACPRFGCGNGQLDWELIRRVVGRILDDRFVIYSNGAG